MIRIALSSMEYFDVLDQETGRVHCGNHQDWYGSRWKRMAGCGPTTVSNIVRYIACSRPVLKEQAENAPGGPVFRRSNWTKTDSRELMDLIWRYVTPGVGGVNSTERLRKGVARYVEEKGLRLRFETMDVAAKGSPRPPLADFIVFLNTALSRDTPVALLNLDNGAEKHLDEWHWVTVTAIEYEPDFSAAVIDILDNGKKQRVDLGRWLRTTGKGGGFVRFDPVVEVSERDSP